MLVAPVEAFVACAMGLPVWSIQARGVCTQAPDKGVIAQPRAPMPRFPHAQRIALVGLALAFAASCVQPASAEPLVMLPTGHPATDLRIGSQGPFRFIIDTAATRTSLLPAFRTSYSGPLTATGQMQVQGAAGAAPVGLVTVPSVEVAGRVSGPLETYSLPAGSVDRLPIHGVLGADLLKRFSVAFDPGAATWDLADSHVTDAHLSYRPFQLDSGDTPRMTVTINGVEVVAVIDTGAQGSFLNAAAARRLGLSPADPTARDERPARGTSAGQTASFSVCLAAFSYDARPARPTRMRVADLSIFQSLGLADQPAMILGFDLMGRARLVVDYPGGRVGFGSSSAQSAC